MPRRKVTRAYIAAHLRRVLKDGGSTPHSAGVQHFFKEEIKSRGWYTADLRKLSKRFRQALLRERGLPFLMQVADKLFSGRVLEEKVLAVLLLETLTARNRKVRCQEDSTVSDEHSRTMPSCGAKNGL